jgi:hypothetical protein
MLARTRRMGSDRLISGRVFCAICFVAFGLLVPVVSFAASLSNSTVTIDRAVELARQYNPDLAAVARELIIAHGELT